MKMTSAAFDMLVEKDGEVLYFVNETGTFGPESLETDGDIYLGDKLLTGTNWTDVLNKPSTVLASGLKIYYNGVDVTNNASMQQTVANAVTHWYGSQGAYNNLVDNNQVKTGVAYHIQVQSDWSEDDPNHLGHIKNQPNLLNMEVVSQDHGLRFFYTKYNQEITQR